MEDGSLIKRLPVEVWNNVLLIAHIKATANAMQTCRDMAEICRSEGLWKQFCDELARSQCLNLPSDLSKVSFPSGVTPSWYQYCKILVKNKKSRTLNSSYDYLFKIVFLGDAGTGKSALFERHLKKAFKLDYTTTIGADFGLSEITVDGKIIRLQLWDTAGQEKYAPLMSMYFRGCAGVICVIDLSTHTAKSAPDYLDRMTVRLWHALSLSSEEEKLFPVVIVGSKKDLLDSTSGELNPTEEAISAWSKEHGYPYLSTSAKTGENVDEVFEEMGRRAKHMARPTTSPRPACMMPLPNPPPSSSCNC